MPFKACFPRCLPSVPKPGLGPDNNIPAPQANLSVREGPQRRILLTLLTEAPPC